MEEMAPFTTRSWESFYVIVGSSAGALTGLQFVVLTLIAEGGMIRGTGATLSAFASPNVVHFCTALLVSAILSAPWHGMGPPGVAVALTGAGGLLYALTVLRRTMRQRDYKPVLEDWVWHAALPILAYGALSYAGLQLAEAYESGQYIIGGATLLLVFVGIHNAWDTVMYVMLERTLRRETPAAVPAAAVPPATPAVTPVAPKEVESLGPPPTARP
jgi:hypothetical protein